MPRQELKITRYERSNKVNCCNFDSFFPVESLTNQEYGGRVRIIRIIITPIFEQGRHLQLKLREMTRRNPLYSCLAKSNLDAGSCYIFNCLSYVRERCGVICGGEEGLGDYPLRLSCRQTRCQSVRKPLPLFVFRQAGKKKELVKAAVSQKL